MTRLTRSLRAKGARITRKQRGGADWYVPEENWSAELEAAGLQKLSRLFEPVSTNINEVRKEERTQAWLEALVHQDELMQLGMDMIKKKFIANLNIANLNIADTADLQKTVEDNINTFLDASAEIHIRFRGIIMDLEGVLTLQQGTKFTNKPPTNKFESMFGTSSNLPLEVAGLLLNPARAENLLVQAVGHVIVSLLDTTNYTDILNKLKTSLFKELLIKKYSMYTVNYVQALSNEQLRDGWVIGGSRVGLKQNKGLYDEESITDFWTTFVNGLSGTDAGSTYAALALQYLTLRKSKSVSISDIIDAMGTTVAPGGVALKLSDISADGYPPEDYLTQLKPLINKLKEDNPLSLTFMLHIHGCVERFLKEEGSLNAASNSSLVEIP